MVIMFKELFDFSYIFEKSNEENKQNENKDNTNKNIDMKLQRKRSN